MFNWRTGIAGPGPGHALAAAAAIALVATAGYAADARIKRVELEGQGASRARVASDGKKVEYPDITFVDKTAKLGLGLITNWAVAWADLNNDGYVDVFDGSTWLNRNGSGFTRAPVDAPPGVGTGIHADYDNDGDLDRYVPNTSLFRNKSGTGELESQPFPKLPQAAVMSFAWADLNGDSYVDLYIGGGAGTSDTDAIAMNNGGKSFTVKPFGGSLYTRGVAACDFDEDSDMDVLASRYWFQANQLWRNDGKGNLTDFGGTAGVHGAGHTISSAWGDFDNDGHFDIFACNFNHHDNRRSEDAILYRNLGPSGGWRFKNVFTFGGSDWQESYASCALADYDNDGDLDIFITTVYEGNFARLYRNDGNWKFTNVTGAEGLGGIGTSQNYQAAWGDYDNDGDMDLITDKRLFENQGSRNHSLKVRLAGNGRSVNSAAIGAQVRIEVPGLGTLVRQVEGGTGQRNQNDLTLHFGLGGHDAPVDLKVAWPDGSTETVRTAVDRTVVIRQK